MNAVCSFDKVSRKISVLFIEVSPTLSKEYTSWSFSILYLKSYFEPLFATKTCLREGTSFLLSASLIISCNWNNFLAINKSASCFDLLQCSWVIAKFDGSSFPPFARGRIWSILVLLISRSISFSQIKHLWFCICHNLSLNAFFASTFKESRYFEFPMFFASFYSLIWTFFPLNATPYLKIFLTPLVVSSVSYFLSLICFSAFAESSFSSSSEQSLAALSSMRTPGILVSLGQRQMS